MLTPSPLNRHATDSPALIELGRWSIVGVVGFALFMDYLIYGVVIPLTPYSPAINSEEQLGLLYGGYSAGVLLATPLFGYLGDRIGYRWPMIMGAILSALTVVMFAFTTNFYLLLLGRLMQGAAASATWTAGLALIAAHYPRKRVETIGFALMGSTAGSVLGPVIGGALYQIGGYQLPFAAVAVLVLIDVMMRVFLLPRDHGSAGASPDLRSLLLDRSVLVAAAAVTLAAIGWGIVEPLLPVELRHSGVSPAAVGMIFTAGSIVYGLSAPVVSRVSEMLPIRTVIIGGTIAMAVALPVLSLLEGIVGAAVGLCAVSICYAFMLNPTSAELGDAVDRRGLSCYAAVYAVYNVAYAVGQMAASAFASAASTRLSFFYTTLAVAVALLAFAPVLALKDATLPAMPPPLPVPQEDRRT
jgi:MFS transporter, DHA1 family, solute carrier family 18 (vesicular amine transporter), member 1/2